MRTFTVGFANGCFDLFHEGHRHFLTRCRTYCDYLVVAVNSDRYCRHHKGHDRPHDGLIERMLHVRAFAEAVVPFEGQELELIHQINPGVIIKGADHRGDQYLLARLPRHIAVVYIDRLPDVSTSTESAKLADAPPKG